VAQYDLPANVAFLACLVCLAEAKRAISAFCNKYTSIFPIIFFGLSGIFEPAQSNFGKLESD